MKISHLFKVFAWGDNRYGQLGQTDVKFHVSSKLVNGLQAKRIVCISCSCFSSVAVTDRGDVYSWGGNMFGQLGIGHCSHRKIPEKVIGLESAVICNAILLSYITFSKLIDNKISLSIDHAYVILQQK